jgi:hypothetical protein
METKVRFKDDNKTMAIATGFKNEQSASSAVEIFLAKQGKEYGFQDNPFEEKDEEGNPVFYFRVTDYS